MDNTEILVYEELGRARIHHPAIRNLHEGYAVILEELDETWEEIKKKSPDNSRIKKELIQVSAMAQRVIQDLNL